MTPKMKATLDEEIHEAARKLFLSSSVADLCKMRQRRSRKNSSSMSFRQSLQPERRTNGTAS